MIPNGRQSIDEEDIRAVTEVLQSNWLTTGPKIREFEAAIANFVDTDEAVAVSSGTAALHSAMHAIGIGPGDEVILPPMTFVATANAVVYQGGTPVFADVDADTLLIDAAKVVKKITDRTKAIIAVDYAGQPCDYDELRAIAERFNVYLIADGCHALGARYKFRKVGQLADLTIFSFHPVKHITTGEGGAVCTDSQELAERIRRFRNHGITQDSQQRMEKNTWFYEINDLGYNYRISDLQCALGLSQLGKLPRWLNRRREIADQYNDAFKEAHAIKPPTLMNYAIHAYHLYVIQLSVDEVYLLREKIFNALRQKGIAVNVQYIPVHLHPFYKSRFGLSSGLCPVAESAYERIISLPIYHALTNEQIKFVVKELKEVVNYYAA